MRMQSLLREKPSLMEDLMDEIEVAEMCDVALELPRILFDAVVDLEAPMKATAASSNANAKARSKSADSNIRFWRQNDSPVRLYLR